MTRDMNRDMKREIVEQIADSVLYEGYILYPYRPAALKNRQRWNFGGLCPPGYADLHDGSESCRAQTECLALGAEGTLRVKIRFLHLIDRRVASLPDNFRDLRECPESDLVFVDNLKVGERIYQTWQEATERAIDLPALNLAPAVAQQQRFDFHLPESKSIEPLTGPQGKLAGAIVRKQNALNCAAHIAIQKLDECLFKIRLEILNLTTCPEAASLTRDQAMTYSLVSTHAILNICGGEFISSLDPPQEYADAVSSCANVGLYPVLAGDEAQRSTMLASPVILYDYPKVAPESAGDLFDGAEIDEILTLRILALGDQEKAEMRQCDERARRILDRVESDPEHLARLHGAMRAMGVEGSRR
ncbi:MAG TPA: hypothetical protein VG322_15235 [Candidatus Acidoferrales bacterium]|jgi:hypothetical protein|nr:hypothetical protein [Candidatus Acidoferrales bacterium]